MRITRLYHAGNITCGDTTQLGLNASNHLARVLRAKAGTPVILFNGNGFDYHGKTLDADPKKTSIEVESKVETKSESSLSITLIQGLSRHDRMDTTIQKAVELGVNKIIPVICQRSNVKLLKDKKIKKLEHWQKVAISACEQSGRSIIPEITEITTFNSVDHFLDKASYQFILNPDAQTSLKEIDFEPQPITIFIGPEGGLNDDEIKLLEESGYMDIRFGPRILRTETAGPAVISALQMLWGDF